MLLAQDFFHHNDEIGAAAADDDDDHVYGGHEQDPGSCRDYLLTVIDSALKVLDNSGEEEDKQRNKKHRQSNILPQ